MARAANKPKKEISMEEALWKSADKLRGSVEPAEYKHVVLSLFFLKFASDKFETQRKAKAHMSPPHKHITILKIPCGLISTRQPWLWWHKGLPFINYNTIERKFQYNVMTSKSCNYPSNYASQKTKNKSP